MSVRIVSSSEVGRGYSDDPGRAFGRTELSLQAAAPIVVLEVPETTFWLRRAGSMRLAMISLQLSQWLFRTASMRMRKRNTIRRASPSIPAAGFGQRLGVSNVQ